MKNLIPTSLYEKILENMPICCIDVVVKDKEKVLLVKRINEPEKNEWWVPGGRIKKGESLEEGVKRILKEETGLEIRKSRFLGVYEYKSEKTNFDNVKTGTHGIVLGYTVETLENSKVDLDKTSSEYRWINKIEDSLKGYVKQILKDSGALN